MTARAIGTILPKRLTGSERGHDQRVWRESYDVGDRRAQVFTRIDDGSPAGAKAWIEAMIRVAREYSLFAPKRRGTQGIFSQATLRVFEELLRGHWVEFKTGRIDPALSQLQKATGLARSTVQRALETLRTSGFLSWVRRSEVRDDADGGGRRRKQVTNGYFLRAADLPKNALRRLHQLVQAGRRRRAANPLTAPETAPAAAQRPADPELAALLDRIEEGLDRPDVSREPGKSPASGVQG